MGGVNRPYEETHKFIDRIEFKLCSKCDEWLPLNSHYYNNKSAPDGHNPYCKECTKKKSSKWQKDNSQKYAKLKKKYNSKPDSLMKHRERNKKWRSKGKQREWYTNHPDLLREYAKVRSNKRHDISKEEWESCKGYFNNQCAYCGMSYDEHKELYNTDLHREHVDAEGSNKLDNCIPACLPCNSSKGTYSLDDWYSEGNEVFEEEKLKLIKQWLDVDYKPFIKVKINN